ncbi:hypothetical protein B0H17DRAFT_1222223 [Mycena rosella]|uniref:Uncharacterized protein n=1 Tax=Mycena rosella TaxID=1033263 RepID=A0AAD7F941_MYCRO|nr:hypothetical protein B0H17DRAFT_1222223 [Mycena rosella]
MGRDPALQELFEIARSSKDHTSVLDYAALQRQPQSDKVHDYLEQLSPALADLVKQETRIQSWIPTDTDAGEESISAMESLNIAFFDGSIELLVDKLGTFQLDPILRERVREILDPHTPRTLANVLAFYFTRAFAGGCVLSKVFSFPYKPVSVWANQQAELVSLSVDGYSVVSYDGLSLPVQPLGGNSTDLSGVSAWLDDTDSAAFCVLRTLDPDLLFVLRLADGTFVRITLHASTCQTALGDVELKTLVKRLDNGNLFSNKTEHDYLVQSIGNSV